MSFLSAFKKFLHINNRPTGNASAIYYQVEVLAYPNDKVKRIDQTVLASTMGISKDAERSYAAGMVLNGMYNSLGGDGDLKAVGVARMTAATVSMSDLRDYIVYLISAKRMTPFGVLCMDLNLESHDPQVWKSRLRNVIQELTKGNYTFLSKPFDM
jgi:hypothetical protein